MVAHLVRGLGAAASAQQLDHPAPGAWRARGGQQLGGAGAAALRDVGVGAALVEVGEIGQQPVLHQGLGRERRREAVGQGQVAVVVGALGLPPRGHERGRECRDVGHRAQGVVDGRPGVVAVLDLGVARQRGPRDGVRVAGGEHGPQRVGHRLGRRQRLQCLADEHVIVPAGGVEPGARSHRVERGGQRRRPHRRVGRHQREHRGPVAVVLVVRQGAALAGAELEALLGGVPAQLLEVVGGAHAGAGQQGLQLAQRVADPLAVLGAVVHRQLGAAARDDSAGLLRGRDRQAERLRVPRLCVGVAHQARDQGQLGCIQPPLAHHLIVDRPTHGVPPR